MQLHDVMKRDVMRIPSSMPASEAWALMRDEGVRHAVVDARGEIVGVVSERDLGGARGGATRRSRTVADLMTREVVTATGETTVAAAAREMRERRIGCLPVVENGRLIGIVTTSDLIALLATPAFRADLAPDHRTERDAPPHLVSPTIDKHP